MYSGCCRAKTGAGEETAALVVQKHGLKKKVLLLLCKNLGQKRNYCPYRAKTRSEEETTALTVQKQEQKKRLLPELVQIKRFEKILLPRIVQFLALTKKILPLNQKNMPACVREKDSKKKLREWICTE